MKSYLLAVIFVILATTAYADCEDVLYLSRQSAITIINEQELTSSIDVFCRVYKSNDAAQNTKAFSLAYDTLSFGHSGGKMSKRQVYEKYCSLSAKGRSARSSYANYVNTISNGAYDAYESCLMNKRRGILLSAPLAAVLPNSMRMTINMDPAFQSASAKFNFDTEEGVTCKWVSSNKPPNVLTNQGNLVLSCKRRDRSHKNSITLIPENTRVKTLTVTWGAYKDDDTPLNTLRELNAKIDQLTDKIDRLGLGEPDLKKIDNVYQALTDGLVVVNINTGGKSVGIHGIINGKAGKNKNNLKTRNSASMQYYGAASASVYMPTSSFTMPIIKGEWWKVENSSNKQGKPFAATIYWVPLGIN